MKRSAAQFESDRSRVTAVPAAVAVTERLLGEKGVEVKGKSARMVSAPTAVMNGNEAESKRAGEGEDCTVLVVGAGPAGLMLGATLARYGIDVQIVDDRADKTSTGRADGLQPKTVETFQQLRLADDLLKKGVKVYDICFWESSPTKSLSRASRVIHYPTPQVDTLDPYILLVHQGMIEDVFLEDLRSRGVEVTRNSPFISCMPTSQGLIASTCSDLTTGGTTTLHSKYVVGCDGAHSMVRKSLPSITMDGESGKAAWGVLDGVITTDFPDLWSKCAIHSHTAGSILCIPRERNMTRLYIELHPGTTQPLPDAIATQSFVMQRAREILQPYTLTWTSIEWFSIYRVGQRVASAFTSAAAPQQIYIAGDAAHTHSPKAAQGMNVSMHDTFNLSWKLTLAARGLAHPKALLDTYELERRHIAQELIAFDHAHASAFEAGDAHALRQNFDDNIRFISGVGAEYPPNILNWSMTIPTTTSPSTTPALKPGALLPPARVTRYLDSNPVHLQRDIPLLGQFRLYIFTADVHRSADFLSRLSAHLVSPTSSVLGRASAAAAAAQRRFAHADADDFSQPRRYVALSELYTPALVTTMSRSDFELAHLPAGLRRGAAWTVYLDDVAGAEGACTRKYLGRGMRGEEVVLVNVRPDGYVGSVGWWVVGEEERAMRWLDEYYGGFLVG